MNELRKKIAAFLEENREAMIADIQAFARIRSVSQAAKAEENAPFGPECRQMLDFALAHAKEMGFDACVPVSGQTYSRKVDSRIVNVLGGIAQSCSKFSNDLRILANFKEMEEPFEKNQIGSSAMPYKRNPMRAERITSLARYVMIDTLNPAFTAGTQWF